MKKQIFFIFVIALIFAAIIIGGLLSNNSRSFTSQKTDCYAQGDIKPEAFPDEIELIVVPGIAFDRNGNRIGRGQGYYDRFLAGYRHKGVPFIGLAFDFQVVQKIPSLPHDIPVTKLITA